MVKSVITLTLIFAILYNFLNVSAENVGNADYCKFKCEDQPVAVHTLCKYKNPELSKACTDVQRIGLTQDEIQKIVAVHNKLRQYVASGKEERGNPGPQPAAKNIPNLEWDDELELIAQRWANQCMDDHDCAPVARFEVGQNFAQERSSNSNPDLESFVQDWYAEVQYFNRKDVSSFVSTDEDDLDVEHYTQVVWAKTTKIGCGLITYREESIFVTNLFCNYGEAGNYDGESVYEMK